MHEYARVYVPGTYTYAYTCSRTQAPAHIHTGALTTHIHAHSRTFTHIHALTHSPRLAHLDLKRVRGDDGGRVPGPDPHGVVTTATSHATTSPFETSDRVYL